ncbi:hypothetical protein HYU93_03295 [Candidatus Daviesbacteria bacterium]|nr:hypothetical protein [Candidatus Daviesbacteria bacterium]
MIKHIWTVLCRQSILNKDDNTISLLNVLEDLKVTIKPSGQNIPDMSKGLINLPFNFELVSLWEFDNPPRPKAQVEITYEDPSGKKLANFIQGLEIPQDKNLKRIRSRVNIQGISAGENGRYIFIVSIKEGGSKLFMKVAEIPLQITIEKEFPKKSS